MACCHVGKQDGLFNRYLAARRRRSISTTGQMRAATRSLRDAIEKGVIPKSNFTSTQLEDIMAGNRTINGYIWHHNAQSAPNNMQLVPLEIHDAVRHTGQNTLKKGR